MKRLQSNCPSQRTRQRPLILRLRICSTISAAQTPPVVPFTTIFQMSQYFVSLLARDPKTEIMDQAVGTPKRQCTYIVIFYCDSSICMASTCSSFSPLTESVLNSKAYCKMCYSPCPIQHPSLGALPLDYSFSCSTLPVPSCHATRRRHESWDTVRLPKPRQGKSRGRVNPCSNHLVHLVPCWINTALLSSNNGIKWAIETNAPDLFESIKPTRSILDNDGTPDICLHPSSHNRDSGKQCCGMYRARLRRFVVGLFAELGSWIANVSSPIVVTSFSPLTESVLNSKAYCKMCYSPCPIQHPSLGALPLDYSFSCSTLPVPSCHATRRRHESWDTVRLPKPRQGKSRGRVNPCSNHLVHLVPCWINTALLSSNNGIKWAIETNLGEQTNNLGRRFLLMNEELVELADSLNLPIFMRSHSLERASPTTPVISKNTLSNSSKQS
ncbi:hypothetical protein T265_10669 [Opisthorchis viverrini]|uniref:Uncharacterized protein n=1 Tax=Opisthorchis viverrini TaxID=6198 RepID=A0A074ZCC9_OPIVI|nr:hypothetical protein T265_10669 [Opisthorchis viverrini]KER20860.1 hypothetical protein T265_10669 [Opisthorchis viverrini]